LLPLCLFPFGCSFFPLRCISAFAKSFIVVFLPEKHAMKKLTALKCFKNFILEGFTYLLVEFVDMMMPEWLYAIMSHWLNGRSMIDYLAEQPEPRADATRIKTHSVVKSKVAFDFNPN
jgi:hypothetical protein